VGDHRLYEQYNPLILRYLATNAGDAAEDLAHDAWMSAARTIRSFEGDERAFGGWLFTVVRRRLMQHWRDTGRHPSVPMPGEALVDVAPAVSDNASAEVVARAAASELVAGLPDKQADIVLLRVVAGLEAEEVGQVVGKTAAAVRVSQHRALRSIRERMVSSVTW
jgi:RNA polymerase sigma-70 factor (ECF subfamily)